jgi:hypothetical protein
MRSPEKGSPKRRQEMNDLNEIGDSDSTLVKECLPGRKRRGTVLQRLRTALYLRVSTADQKPDLLYDGPGDARQCGIFGMRRFARTLRQDIGDLTKNCYADRFPPKTVASRLSCISRDKLGTCSRPNPRGIPPSSSDTTSP